MNIRAMNFEIICPINADWDKLGKALRDVQYAVWKTYNRTIQMTWDFQQFSFSYKENFGQSLKFADLGTGNKTQASDVYSKCTMDYPYVSTSILDSAIKDAQARFKASAKDVLNGIASIPSYKRDIPIPIRAQQTKVTKEAHNYLIKFPLLSKGFAKDSDLPTSFTVKVKARGAAKTIIDRLISGEYKLGDSKILRKGKKWFVSLVYKHEVKPVELSKSRVMGVDIGVVNAAVLAYNFSSDRYFFDGSEIRSFRARTEARRNQLLRQYKHAGARKGHGRTTALQPIEKLRDNVANFRKTLNHRYSRKIVDEAVRNGCGVIQMENLSGISGRDRFLASWPYYDLQTKIKYKAKEAGIEVREINPRYTSQRCSCCGYIAEGNRKTQELFECVACGYKANADYNAARNIAEPDIETLIDKELDRQRLALKLAE